MNYIKITVFTLFLLASALLTLAQERVTTFGLQLKPMIGGSLINEGDPSKTENNVEFAYDKLFGFSGGMVIRHGFTKMFSIESGLSFVQRNFKMRINDEANNYQFEQEFGIVGYELPVLGLVYIQLSQQVFMNTSFGMAFDLFPSDVAVFEEENRVIMEGTRESWIQAALTANIGWEWRTKEKGSFYIGGTYHRTFGDSFGFLAAYDYKPLDPASSETISLVKVNGNYLTLDFRYFFHEDPDKRKVKKEKR
ncbi:MAG: hypothetical protein KDC83_03760 [Flavobacteriales bacterium]|nr:hypothetical protein [Flavobacteriales bacterium]